GEILYFLLLFLIITNAENLDKLPGFIQYILGLATLAVMFSFQLSLLSRRLHDVGRNDLEYQFPYFHTKSVSGIFIFFVPGEKKENKYGKPPKPQIDIKSLLGLFPNVPLVSASHIL